MNGFPDPESAVGASSGGHRAILNMFNIAQRRRPIGSRTCTMQLRVVINKTPSPYKSGSRTILCDFLEPTDANVRIARHSANVNGVPTRRRMVLSRYASDYIGGQSGHRIGYCEAGIIQHTSWQSLAVIPKRCSSVICSRRNRNIIRRFLHQSIRKAKWREMCERA